VKNRGWTAVGVEWMMIRLYDIHICMYVRVFVYTLRLRDRPSLSLTDTDCVFGIRFFNIVVDANVGSELFQNDLLLTYKKII
jgi:hypothetical protein